MGLYNRPDIFYKKMIELMTGLKFCRAYLDDMLIISKGIFDQNLEQLEQVLTQLSEAGIKIIASTCVFCQTEFDYLGY